jgi:hypothetical protein
MSLPTGNYILHNDGDGPVGIQSPIPPVQPIARVTHNETVSPMPFVVRPILTTIICSGS